MTRRRELTASHQLQTTLAKWGMIVELAESGPDALAMLYRTIGTGVSYPLIIVDGHIPLMDGFALLERIRGAKELKVGKAMMLTSAEQVESSRRCQELGVSEYAIKPVSSEDLLRLLLRMIGDSALTEPGSPDETSRTEIGIRPLRILLAEDNLYNQKVAVGMLEMDRHQITIANNGREAVEIFSELPFDLVFMDMQMPEMDGKEATKVLRRQQTDRGIRVPIVAMTAHAMTGDREKCLEAGLDDYISKPTSRDELRAVIARNSSPVPRSDQGVQAVQSARPVASGPAPLPQRPAQPAKEAPGGPSSYVIDKEQMLVRLGGNQQLLQSLLEMFPEESGKLMTGCGKREPRRTPRTSACMRTPSRAFAKCSAPPRLQTWPQLWKTRARREILVPISS